MVALSGYAIVVDDDVLALEHRYQPDPPYCLVYATTLDLSADAVLTLITRHDVKCQKETNARTE